jgi:hypothetical protein
MATTAEKRESFLNECVDYLKAHINDEDKLYFYKTCISHLTQNEELLSSDFEGFYEGKSKTPKTLTNWVNQFIELLELEKHDLWQSRSDKSLTKFPSIKKNQRKSGGAGNKTNYSIVPTDIDDVVQLENEISFVSSNKKLLIEGPLAVKYHSKKLEKTPWYIKACSRYFTDIKSRQILILLLLSLAIVSCISLAAAFLGFIPLYPGLGITAFCIIIFNPTCYLLSINLNKACLIEHIYSPCSAICISEIIPSEDIILNKSIKRRLVTRIVEGDCPICTAKHNLEKSVMLENHGLFTKKIIGVCSNNPKEHRFSFDKDLMSGVRL